MPDPADDEYGFIVKPRWDNHNVAVTALSSGTKPLKALTTDPSNGAIRYLTTGTRSDQVNVRIARYTRDRALVLWDRIDGITCSAGICSGAYAGTFGQLVDGSATPVGAAEQLPVQAGGDLVTAPAGLAWPFVDARPDYQKRGGASPTTTTITLAVLA